MCETTQQSNDDLAKMLWAQRCATLFHLQVQVRYQRRRQRFFDLVDKLTKTASVILGVSLIGQWVKDVMPETGAAVGALGLLALVFGYSDRKQQHKELAEQAAKLVSDILRIPASALTETNVASFEAERFSLIQKAHAPLKTLTVICEHEQAVADNNPDHIKRPCFCKRMVADFVS